MIYPEGVNKPKPYIYLHAAKILGLSPDERVVIEDSRIRCDSRMPHHQLHATFFQGKPMPANLREFMKISFAQYVKQGDLPRKAIDKISFSPPLANEMQKTISTTRFSSYVKIHF